MNPERWQRVKEIFGAALEREPSGRVAFLEEACAGDVELRREVESLLAADSAETGLLGKPLSGLAAELLGGESGAHAGRTFGHYEAEREIGRGGMGEVYLARDSRLGRPVALKLLPPSFTSDPQRVARFQREAHAVSHLNHPNIVTVYEVGEADGLRFIVTEYVEGETLRELLARGPLPPGRALDIAVQIASALAAAHEAGVVHRDVKPENVMVRPDGYVKVLDFGLAKLTEAVEDDARQVRATALKLSTQPGLVMGTVAYMSPEQARGLPVDARTDVWSLGVVLYEMLAGRAPFEGETVSHVIVNILEHEPEPLSRKAPDAPEQLQKVVGRALDKDREARHASMRDMLAELREARDEATFRARQELHLSGGGTNSNPSLVAAPAAAAPRRSKAMLWVALVAVAVSALAFGVYEFIKSRRAPRTPPVAKLNRVTSNGKVSQVAVTRDGKYIAYVAGRQQSLWVMQPSTGSEVQLVQPAEGVTYWGLTFTPEGDYVYFVRALGNNPWELYRVPTLGGTPKKLLANVDTPVEFSADGRRMVFGRTPSETEHQLVSANADGTGERVVATRKSPAFFGITPLSKIAWSPDGESIACSAGNFDSPGDNKQEMVAVSLKDGTERPLTREKWYYIKQVAWLGDGSGLVLVARDEPSSPDQVWHLSYPEGSVRRLSNDFSVYDNISVTADSSTIATLQSERLSNVWLAPENDAARARQITDSREDGAWGISWTPDGRVVFASKVGANTDIWVMDADGGNRRRLTDNPSWDWWPSVSADGRYIVFLSRRAVRRNVWRMDIDGGNPVQLTDSSFVGHPHCSADGRWVYYSAVAPGKSYSSLWRVAIEGGDPARITGEVASWPVVSPDGKWLAYWYYDTQANPRSGVAIAPAESGPPVKRFSISPEAEKYFNWTPDSRALAYADRSSLNLWAQPIDGGPPRQLTDFKTDQTFYFAWSRDGKQLALARGTQTSDVVLITDFR
jgi:serine/threonine protein kinase/Tol biopolymer transport system component